MIPKIGDGVFHTNIELQVDGKTVLRQPVGTGDFRLSAPVAAGTGKRRIQISFSSTQQLPREDGRQVGGLLQFVRFEAPAAGAAPAASTVSDIVSGSGAELGAGWGVLETFNNETFRWVENDAHILVPPVSSGGVELSLVLEPGPGVGTGPLLLKVLDASGKQVADARVAGRGPLKMLVPIESGKPGDFRLHVDGGGKPAPNEARILNFRVFRLTVEPRPGPAR
jgi:hypothetical protein